MAVSVKDLEGLQFPRYVHGPEGAIYCASVHDAVRHMHDGATLRPDEQPTWGVDASAADVVAEAPQVASDPVTAKLRKPRKPKG